MLKKILVPALFISSCISYTQKEISYIPNGFIGKVAVVFDQDNGAKTEYLGDKRVYRIPHCGILKTQFHELKNATLKVNSINEDLMFVYVDDNGKIVDTIPLTPLMYDWDSVKMVHFYADNANKLFVLDFGGGGITFEDSIHYENIFSFIIDTLKNSQKYRFMDFKKSDFDKCK